MTVESSISHSFPSHLKYNSRRSSPSPPVQKGNGADPFPAHSKIHPSPTFRFKQKQMDAQKPHPSFLQQPKVQQQHVAADDRVLAVQQQQVEESQSAYERQLQQFEQQWAANHNGRHQ